MGEGDATDRKFSTVNGIALRLAPLLSLFWPGRDVRINGL